MKKEKISGCLIVKNESETLEKCIKSMLPVLNELIVVDTGSTDNTVEIAKKYTNKVYHYEWNDNFSAARNFAICKARYEWIIFLDADEYFSENSPRNIRKTIDEENGQADALLTRGYNITGSGQIAETFNVVRVFRNKPELRYHGRIHESLNKKGKFMIADCTDIIEFFHTGYSEEVITNKNKNDRNFSLLLKDIEERPTDGTAHYYLSVQYIGIEDYENTLYHAKKAVEYGVKAMGGEAMAYVNYIKSCLHLDHKDVDSLLDKCHEFISKHPNYPDAHLLLAECLLKKGDLETAALKLEEFLKMEFNDGALYISKVNEYAYKNIFEKLGDIYFAKQSRLDKSVYYYTKLLKLDVSNEIAFQKLMNILLNHEKTAAIIGFLKQLYDEKNIKDVYFLAVQFAKFSHFELRDYYKDKLTALGK